ncbi:MAG TPA: alpha/beta hydrolase [Acidimicrobiales bacterium]
MDTVAVEVGGLRIGYRQAGQGPAVLLLHGGVSDGRVWRQQMEDLAGEFTIVAWDAPGCGASDDPPETFSLADYADCAAGFVEALGLERPHVVGHSFGGGLAIELFDRYPSMPRSLVLMGAYAGWAGSLPADAVEARLTAFLAFEEPFEPRSFPGLFSDVMPPEAAEELTRIMEDVRLAPAKTMIRAFAAADLRHALAGIDVPTLLLYGEDDERSPRFVAEHLHAHIPGSQLVVLPGLGHELSYESPAAFTGAVVPFLRSVG